MTRSGLFQRYARRITAFVIVVCGAWSVWGISGYPEQGDAVGAWKWAAIDPVLGLSQANPPSGVTFWYCSVDSVAMGGAALVLSGLKYVNAWRQSVDSFPAPGGRWSALLGLPEHAREDIQTQIHRTSQAISTSLKNPDLAVEPLDKT